MSDTNKYFCVFINLEVSTQYCETTKYFVKSGNFTFSSNQCWWFIYETFAIVSFRHVNKCVLDNDYSLQQELSRLIWVKYHHLCQSSSLPGFLSVSSLPQHRHIWHQTSRIATRMRRKKAPDCSSTFDLTNQSSIFGITSSFGPMRTRLAGLRESQFK